MSEHTIKPLPKNMMNKVFLALIIGLAGTSSIMFFMGTFTKPEIEYKITDPYRFAYIDHVGPPNNIHGLIEVLTEKMDTSNVKYIDPAVLFLDDASEVKLDDQRSKVGFIISVNTTVPDEFQVMEIPSQKALVATFYGGSLMGSYRTYPAMQDWAAEHGKRLSLPAFEIYHGKTSVEYHMSLVD